MKNPLDINNDGDVNSADARDAASRAGRTIADEVRATRDSVKGMETREMRATAIVCIAAVVIALALVWFFRA